jgi:hypothetical protein
MHFTEFWLSKICIVAFYYIFNTGGRIINHSIIPPELDVFHSAIGGHSFTIVTDPVSRLQQPTTAKTSD